MNQENDPVPQKELSLLDHLDELRKRLAWALVGLAVATVISFAFTEQLIDFLISPYGERLQILGPAEVIEVYFKVALVAGAILAMPFIVLQLWKFIEPAMEAHEKRYVYLFVPAAVALFLIGIAFAWFLLLPTAIFFLANFMSDIFVTEWTAREYISFTTRLLFWIGVSFEMPLIIYLLSRVGLLTAQTLREQWRIAVVVIAFLAALITPTVDPVTMLLAMTPLLALYGFSILLARLGQRQYEASMSVS